MLSNKKRHYINNCIRIVVHISIIKISISNTEHNHTVVFGMMGVVSEFGSQHQSWDNVIYQYFLSL